MPFAWNRDAQSYRAAWDHLHRVTQGHGEAFGEIVRAHPAGAGQFHDPHTLSRLAEQFGCDLTMPTHAAKKSSMHS